MTEGPSESSPSPVPAFRMAFALVGLLVFGASSLVGATLLFGSGYTSTIHCDRAAQSCKVEIPRHSLEVSFSQKITFDSVREVSNRRSAASQMLWLVSHPDGQPEKRDFVCALPDGATSAARLDALAADANRFVQGDGRPVLDLRCEGRTATVANSLMLTGFSLLIAIASAITIVRGLRQMRAGSTG